VTDTCTTKDLNDTAKSLLREITLVQAEIDRRFKDMSKADRDYVDGQVGRLVGRFDGIDKATELLSETVNRVPTEVTKEVEHLQSVIDERFNSVAIQFSERDTRQEREAKDNKVAVDAAFAAQKEAAAEQNKSNTLAISKSEAATSETINKLAELFKGTTDGLYDKVDDLKDRLAASEKRNGTFEAGYTGRETGVAQVWSYLIAATSIGLALVTAVAYIMKK
jgi:cation transport regulator ChaB